MRIEQVAKTLARVGAERSRAWSLDPEKASGVDYPHTDGHFFVSPLKDEVFVGHQQRLFRVDPDTGQPSVSQECDLSFSSPWGEAYDPRRQMVFEADHRAITAMSLQDGKTKWAFRARGETMFGRCAPSVGPDGTVYFGTSHGGAAVYAVDGDTGKLKWKKKIPGVFARTAPAVSPDGKLYVGVLGSDQVQPLFVLDAADGKKLGEIPLERKLTSEPAVGPDGTLFLGYWEGDLEARDPAGPRKWSFQPPDGGDAFGPALQPDGTLVVSSRQGHLYGLDEQGQARWSVDTDSGVHSGVQVTPQGLLVVLDEEGVEAFSPDLAGYQARHSGQVEDARGGSIRRQGDKLFVGGIQLSIRS